MFSPQKSKMSIKKDKVTLSFINYYSFLYPKGDVEL